MKAKKPDFSNELLRQQTDVLLPSVSIDCVIFGFHAGELKVLLLKGVHNLKWALPGGFVYKDEDVEQAATRVLEERTQLSGIFLQQFYLFGDVARTEQKHATTLLQKSGIKDVESHWIMQRFVSVGYYALVEYEKVKPVPDGYSSECTWHSVSDLRNLIIDHKQIVKKGLQSLRLHLNFQPIGYNLLPREFTLKDLQLIYETILGRKLDRSNFQRKILGFGILDRKEKHFTGNSHRAPYLYSFNRPAYFKALKDGLNKDW
jgi:ADP-ribose pyrophosphatase YjhB (NUDIX family)